MTSVPPPPPAEPKPKSAAVGTGITAAATTIIVWLLGEFGVAVPAEVAVAICTCLGGLVGYRLG